uniref:Uncharacterized protein n=1 Tax=Amphimedon queenslandica TaxID=400682 RepID=A0A1X7VT16_AMPQE
MPSDWIGREYEALPILLEILYRIISKIQSQKAYVVLVAPDGSAIPARWSISGNDSMVRAFQAKLQRSFLAHGEQKPRSLMTHFLDKGVAGVVNG